jgi:LysM repeat protein
VATVRKVVILTVALTAALAACGGAGSGSTAASTSLTITTRTGSATVLVPSEATLECGGDTPKATGFLADAPAPACAAVESGAVSTVMKSQKSGQLCSQIYGGPQTAHLVGTVDDKKVDLRVDRTDGCGVSDWTTLEAILGAPERTGDVPKASGSAATSDAPTTTAPTTYTVRKGDTLSSIARQFRVRVSSLHTANPQIKNPDNLVPGEVLTIPTSTRPVLTVTAPPDQPFQLQFALTNALPGEQVTFIVATPHGSFTGPPHIADANGAVNAVYDAGGLAGNYAVLAQGLQGTVARADFHIDAPGP